MADGKAAAKGGRPKEHGPGLKARAASFVADVRRWLRDDQKGWVHLAVAAIVTLVLSAALYWPLGLPGRLLTRILTRATDASCATNTTGVANWFCGFGISLVAMSGAIVVIIAMLLLRRQIRKGGAAAVKQTPAEFHFLEKPVVVTLAFAMAWSSVLFHFYGRMGLIIEGLFPAIVGLLMFALTFWETPIKAGLRPVWGVRDRVPKVARLAVVIAVPILLGYLMTGWMPYGVRDQLAALLAVFIGWVMWTPTPPGTSKAPAGRARATGAAMLLLLALALLLLIAAPVTAQGPCSDFTLYLAFANCELAHHSGTFGGASAGVGVAATAVVLAPTKPEEAVVEEKEEEPEEEEKTDVDPCESQQSTFDVARTSLTQNQEAYQLVDQLIKDAQAEYDKQSTSTLISQSVDLASAAWSLGGRITGWGARTFAGAVAKAGAEIITPALVKEALKEAAVNGNKTDVIKTAKDLMKKAGDKSKQEAIQKALAKSLEKIESDRLVSIGFEEGSYVWKLGMRGYEKTAAEMAKVVGDTAAFTGAATGLATMYWDYQHLDRFLQRIAHMRERRTKLWAESLELQDAFDEAEHQLDMCRYRVAHGLEVA